MKVISPIVGAGICSWVGDGAWSDELILYCRYMFRSWCREFWIWISNTAIFSMLMEIAGLGVQVRRTVNLRQWRRRGICTGAGYETCCGSVLRVCLSEKGCVWRRFVWICVFACVYLFVCDSVYAGVCESLSIEVSDVVNVTGAWFWIVFNW